MDPITAGLFVGASIGASLLKNKKVAKATKQQVEAELQQARVQAAEMSYERTKSYRESVSYMAALSAMGVGGSTGFRGASASSSSALSQDLKAIQQRLQFAEQSGAAAIKAAKAGQTFGNIGSVVEGVGLAKQLGVFDKKAKIGGGLK